MLTGKFPIHTACPVCLGFRGGPLGTSGTIVAVADCVFTWAVTIARQLHRHGVQRLPTHLDEVLGGRTDLSCISDRPKMAADGIGNYAAGIAQHGWGIGMRLSLLVVDAQNHIVPS